MSSARDAVTTQVPTPVALRTLPVRLQGPVGVPRVSAPVPEPPEARRVMVCPKTIESSLSKRTGACVALAMTKVSSTGGAASYWPLPACVARSTHWPAPVTETVRPLAPDTWQVVGVRLATTGARPLDAVGATMKGAAP